ncbi:permease domain protein [Treponema primitia ZAS-2]|uniref:Permease domain protein n=1 Tax=Treponema primitia (strain ATCC BAA-887 / DSM 12427 / ZAS-2) TaxID=545694 RepID=F5YQ46_TREPZ|nr:ABC transporter permease [Treponema primitia]AEF86638.1 permease domain protein [Treponema primitia ZAS-2]
MAGKRQRFFIKMVVSSIVRRRSRMFVALLAIAIGATILSGLITVYYDIPRQMGREFRSYGANLVIVPSGLETVLTTETVKAAVAYLPGEELIGAAPYSYRMVKINEQPFMAAGTDLAEARKASPYWFVSGRWPEREGEALIGQQVSEMIRLNLGSPFTITGTDSRGQGMSREFTVSGIVQTGGTEEAFIFMSLSDFEAMMAEGDRIDVVECSVSSSGEDLQALADRISAGIPGAEARLVKRVTQSEGAVLTKLQGLVYLVTVIVLLLIMICVATTMMAVVAERRQEIGLRKALGAANSALVLEFLGEGAFLGALGGLLGAVFGFIFAQAVAMNVFNRPISFIPQLAPLTVIASVFITGLACLIPVRSATEVDPAIVLRGE